MCSLSQHADCVGYDVTDPLSGSYKCPHCHVISVSLVNYNRCPIHLANSISCSYFAHNFLKTLVTSNTSNMREAQIHVYNVMQWRLARVELGKF